MGDKITKLPHIRFAGFTDAWEQRKLGEVAVRITRKNKDLESTLPLTISAQDGLIDQNEFFNKTVASRDVSGYYLVKNGEFAYNKSYSNGYPWGAVKRLDRYEMGLLSTLYIVFEPTDIDSDFLAKYYDGGNWHKEVSKHAAEGARNHGLLNIAASDFFETELTIPLSKSEQKQIGVLFNNLDNLINLHQCKLELLKVSKKSMLQKMFPKDGENVPEIRFVGFTDAWEQSKFCEIAETRRGLTYKPGNICSDGKRVLRSSNINDEYFEIYDDDVFVDENAINIPYVKNGDILITSANGSSRLVGKHAIIRNIPDDSTVHGGFMLIASSSQPEFLNASMSSQWYTKFINVFVSGGNGAIGNLNKSDLDEQLIYVPKVEEQEKVGEYFSNLDNLITLHQRELDLLKDLKKSMLQQMFI